MAYIGKAILTCQVYLTAIMTLVAGMPHFVCRCPDPPAKIAGSRSTDQAAACCCCGSCGPTEGQKKSCCSQGSQSGNLSKGEAHFPQAGSDCTNVTGIPKVPAVSTTKSSKPIDVSSAWVASIGVLASSLQADPQASEPRWTGHSPAPPADRVISLQRLLI